jgi:hypothetical protein
MIEIDELEKFLPTNVGPCRRKDNRREHEINCHKCKAWKHEEMFSLVKRTFASGMVRSVRLTMCKECNKKEQKKYHKKRKTPTPQKDGE